MHFLDGNELGISTEIADLGENGYITPTTLRQSPAAHLWMNDANVSNVMDQNLEALARALDSSEADRRFDAARQLATLGEAASATAVNLVRCCGDENEDVREWAVAALEDCGPPNVAHTESLIRLLGDPSADVAYWAATLLGRLQAAAKICVRPLISALNTRPEPTVRQRIVWALGEIGSAASDAMPMLEAIAADNGDPRLQRLAERACNRIRG